MNLNSWGVLPSEVELQILRIVENPPILGLTCKKFCSYMKDLFKSLFNQNSLLLSKTTCGNSYRMKSLICRVKAIQYEGGQFFLEEINEKYFSMKLSFMDCVHSINNWVAIRENFNNTKQKVIRSENQEHAITDCVYLNPLSYIFHESDYCKIRTRNSQLAALPLRASAYIPKGDIALNHLQRQDLYVSTGESVTIEILNSKTIPQAKKITYRLSLKGSKKSIPESLASEIKKAFLSIFQGHIINNGYTLYLNLEGHKIVIMITELHDIKGECDIALLNEDVILTRHESI